MNEQIEVRDIRNPGWYWCQHELVRRDGAELGVYAIAVYNVLASYAGHDGKAYPSVATIAKMIGCSEKQVRRALKKLEELGWITIERRYNKEKKQHRSNVYTLHDAPGGTDSQSVGGRDSQSEGVGTEGTQGGDSESHYKESYTNNHLNKKNGGVNDTPPPETPEAEQPLLSEEFQRPSQHPAVIAWRDYIKWRNGKARLPNKGQMSEIIEVVGGSETALQKWRKVLHAWGMAGPNPVNVTGQLDWFRNGIPDHAKQQNGTGKRSGKKSNSERVEDNLALIERVLREAV